MSKRQPGRIRSLRDLVRFAEAHGWAVHASAKNHVVFLSPDGKHRVVAAGTASDHRSLLNLIGQLRRAGLPVPH